MHFVKCLVLLSCLNTIQALFIGGADIYLEKKKKKRKGEKMQAYTVKVRDDLVEEA